MKPARPRYDLEFFYTSFPHRDLVRWYQWEFLRRNPKYCAEYEKFNDKHKAWLKRKRYWYDLAKRPRWTNADEKHFRTKIAPEIVRLCMKWHVVDLHPPQWRFPKHGPRRYKLERSSEPATGDEPELNWDFRLRDELMELGFTGDGGNARRYGHLLLVEFDLHWPMKDQVDFARRVLARAQENFKFGLMKRGGHFPAGRRRFEDYDAHLRVWDLYQKRKSVSEIAKILSEKGPGDYSLQRVRDHLNAARRLILGHYTEIR